MVGLALLFLRWQSYLCLTGAVSVVVVADLVVHGRTAALIATVFGWWAMRLWREAATQAHLARDVRKQRTMTDGALYS